MNRINFLQFGVAALLAMGLLVLATPAQADNQSAVTGWWVVFNNPENCIDNCDGPDLGIPEVGGCVQHGTGGVTTKGTRTLDLVATINDTESACIGGTGGLLNPSGAEVHFIVRTHGAAAVDDPEILISQITTVLGACDLDVCSDVQFARHFAGEDGEVLWHPNVENLTNAGFDAGLAGTEVEGSFTDLARNDDSMTIMVHTALK